MTVRQFCFNEHYTSVSIGVLNGRDLGYFIGVVLLFLSLTLIVLGKKYLQTKLTFKIAYVSSAVLILILSQSLRFRFYLTEEGRYSLSQGTESLLEQVEEPLLIKVYLEGDFPAGFERLRQETQYMLEEWGVRNSNIFFEFINPNQV